jgi:RNA polymerase sigma-32 factor
MELNLTQNFKESGFSQSNKSFGDYVAYVNKIPNLSHAEEISLFEDFINGNVECAKKIALHHLRYVVWFINTDFKNIPMNKEDLVQMGNIGLLKAIRKFKLAFGVRFISYAKSWIYSEIYQYITNNWSVIRKYISKPQKKLLCNAGKYDWENVTMSDFKNISDELNVSIDDVELFKLSYNSKITNIDDGYDDIDIDYINSTSSNSPEALVENDDAIKRFNIFKEAIGELSERSKDIILSRHQNSKMTLDALSKKYNVSTERIRQIEKESIKFMKQWVLEKYPDTLDCI